MCGLGEHDGVRGTHGEGAATGPNEGVRRTRQA